VLENGGRVFQQTMGWDEGRGVTYVQRSKEYAEDYRYFPEPDLPPLEIGQEWLEELRRGLPELPTARRARFVHEYGLGAYEADLLVADRAVADYYEAAVRMGTVSPKVVANWVTVDLFRVMKESGKGIAELPVSPQALVELIGLVEAGTVNLNTGREVLDEMAATGKSARQIVEEKGLAQISDEAALRAVVERVLDENPTQVAQYLAGKEQVAGWLMGQVMRATGGKANPQMVRGLLVDALEKRR